MTSTTATEAEVLAGLKERARETWAAGDYDAIADGIWAAGRVVVERTAAGPGDRVLDVACGSGNAAVQAAQAGATVTGLDLVPELLAAARRRAEKAGVQLDLVEGDAEALPFADGSFDVVLSTFGVMFAPRHAVVAAELVRVLRPGGRLGLTNWSPEGTVGVFFRTVAQHLPPPPPPAEPPLTWGTEAHLHELFDGRLDLTVEKATLPIVPVMPKDRLVDHYLAVFPPLVVARRTLERDGRWAAAEPDIRTAIATMIDTPPEYVIVTGTKRA
jgi:ubiquinone/menaquinone biosynthesis C-methylase UbiE